MSVLGAAPARLCLGFVLAIRGQPERSQHSGWCVGWTALARWCQNRGEQGHPSRLSFPNGCLGESPEPTSLGAETMTHAYDFVGIDVAKDHLDVYLAPVDLSRRYGNDQAGVTALIDDLRSAASRPIMIGLEASGGWERLACLALHAAGMSVRLLSPDEVRAFAKAKRQRAKTDKLDARLLADFVAVIPGSTYRPDPAVARLRQLLKAREALTEAAVQLNQRIQPFTEPQARAPIAGVVAEARQQIQMLDRQILATLRADPAMRKTAALLQSIPGIGPQSAAMIIARLPEITHLSAKQLASLAGVAPHPRQSGARDGQRHIAGGRRDLRRVLFMAATVASRYHPDLSTFYQRLRDSGKAHKVAIVAVINKLIAQCRAVVLRGSPWTQISAPTTSTAPATVSP